MLELSQFLIVFDHDRGALHQDVTIFVDPAQALHAYDAAERHFAEQAHIEVVLIGSDSSGHRAPHPRQLLRLHRRPGTPPVGPLSSSTS